MLISVVQAAVDAFRPLSQPAELTPCLSFADAVTAVQRHQADYAIIPFENSTNGSVVQTLDLLADRNSLYKDIEVCAEYYLTVHHCFMVRKPREGNPPTYSSIKKLYTHPQAWGQCDKFLGRHFKGVERQDVSSTSKAAEIVVNEPTTECSGAIASRFAAEYHGAEVLAENIEDSADNTTRFLILRNVRSERASTSRLPLDDPATAPSLLKTLVLFTVDHNSPGALADALLVFKNNGINLTSINTRPTQKRAWQYVFFVESGRAPTSENKEAVSRVLEGLQQVTESCRYLGTWCGRL